MPDAARRTPDHAARARTKERTRRALVLVVMVAMAVWAVSGARGHAFAAGTFAALLVVSMAYLASSTPRR